MSEQDSPWKEALEHYLPSFLALYFPSAYDAIDWTRGYEWLNTELRQVVRDAELGKRLADVLVKVWRKDGQESWLLIHIEVQGWPEEDFAQRLFVYHYRIFDQYNRQVVTLVVLADDRPNWRPDRFAYDLWGCSLEFRFPTIKLLDLADRQTVLEGSDNPFAIVTRAHLATLQTRQDPAARHIGKVQLIRELYERGLSRDDVLQLFRLIDWMMDLPQELERLFDREVEQIEQEIHMPYVTGIERRAERRGRAEMLILLLEERFGSPLPTELQTRIKEATDPQQLEEWFRRAVAATSLEQFQEMETETHMPYITSIERLAIQKERIEGRAEMLIRALERRFRLPVPEEIASRIRGTTELTILERWFDLVFDTSTLEEFQQKMQS